MRWSREDINVWWPDDADTVWDTRMGVILLLFGHLKCCCLLSWQFLFRKYAPWLFELYTLRYTSNLSVLKAWKASCSAGREGCCMPCTRPACSVCTLGPGILHYFQNLGETTVCRTTTVLILLVLVRRPSAFSRHSKDISWNFRTGQQRNW